MAKPKTPLELKRERLRLFRHQLLAQAGRDVRVTAGQFRFLACILEAMNFKLPPVTTHDVPWEPKAVIGDAALMLDLPECSNRKTCRAHRQALQELRYLKYNPGGEFHATSYYLPDSLPKLDAAGQAKRKFEIAARENKRRAEDEIRSAAKLSSRQKSKGEGGPVGTPGEGGLPASDRGYLQTPDSLRVSHIALPVTERSLDVRMRELEAWSAATGIPLELPEDDD